MKKQLTLCIAVVVATVVLPGVALAQPANDDFNSAAVVGEPLPFSDSISTLDATPAESDPQCGGGPTVWYTYTPSSSGSIAADTFGSDYDTVLWVGTGSPGAFETIGCNDDAGGLQSLVAWDAVAGSAYYVMVGSCCGDPNSPGGNLTFNVGPAPAPAEIHLSVDPRGTFDKKTNTATVRGIADCSGGHFTSISGRVRQRVGRQFITGFFDVFLEECSQGTPWSATATGEGIFAGGKVTVEASAGTCGPINCADDSTTQVVKLSGGKG